MLVHLSQHNAVVGGSILKHVSCEKCGTKYAYELARTETGSSIALMGLGERSASRSAVRGAQKHLSKAFRTASEVVPCPECGWIQADMVAAIQRSIGRRLRAIGIWLPLVAGSIFGFCVFMYASSVRNGNSREAGYRLLLQGEVIIFGLAALCLVLRSFLIRRIKPNEFLPAGLPVLQGTPLPLIIDPATGQYWVVENAAKLIAVEGSPVVAQSTMLALPDTCCICLQPAEVRYKPSDWLRRDFSIAVPVCNGCRASIRRRFFGAVALSVLSLPIVIVVSVLFPFQFRGDLNLVLGAVLGCIAPFAVAPFLIALMSRPYRMRSVDGSRDVIEIDFSNKRYNDITREFVRVRMHQPRIGIQTLS